MVFRLDRLGSAGIKKSLLWILQQALAFELVQGGIERCLVVGMLAEMRREKKVFIFN